MRIVDLDAQIGTESPILAFASSVHRPSASGADYFPILFIIGRMQLRLKINIGDFLSNSRPSLLL